MAEPSSLTSNELNLLVFRYLTESGFLHSAFVFGYEAGVDKMNIDGSLIPPGALITIVQKGLQYIELEANLNCNDKDEDNDFTLLQPIDLIMKDATELQRIIREKKEILQKERDPEKQMNAKGPKKWQKSRTKRVLIKKFAQERDKKEQQKNIEEKLLIGKSAAETELRCGKKL